jgi:hypothetical protein
MQTSGCRGRRQGSSVLLQTNTYKMETYTITKEEYNQLLTIKTNARLLALTMNSEYKKIVNDLCEDYNTKKEIEYNKVIARTKEILNNDNNENRH